MIPCLYGIKDIKANMIALFRVGKKVKDVNNDPKEIWKVCFVPDSLRTLAVNQDYLYIHLLVDIIKDKRIERDFSTIKDY